ncbi:MAG TPA: response regulator, partial [Longimicrobiaceae bacterium]
MTGILTAGLPAETVGWLARRLPEATVEAAGDGRALLRALAARSWAVVVLDTLPDLPPTDALRALRSLPEGRSVPVVFCSRARVDAATGQFLVGRMGVTHLLLHPVDRDELLRHVAALAATPVAEDVPEAARAGLSGAVGELWERFRGSVLERVSVVEECALAVLEGTLDEELRRRGEREAHKLTGAVGTFGFTEGSRLAREAEGLLEGAAPLGPPQALRLSELAVALRAELERPAPPQEAPAARMSDDRPLLLVVDDDRELAERLVIEAAGRQFRTEVAARVTDARRALIRHRPDVVLLDLSFDEEEELETGLDLLSELSDRVPPVPVVVLTARGGFSDRVEAARRGARGFLQKPTPPAQVIDAAQQVLQRSAPADTRVLAVDDDPHVLQALRALLEPRGVHVTTLDDPLRFWDVLEEAAPDLLVLDVDMPHLNGIELCRVVRNDARWSGTPVLFLTARSDPHSIHRVFAAGADDYVAKPFVGPELVTRIVNRLDRVHLHRSRAETDPLTGVANRRKSEEVVIHFLHLAARQKQPFSLAVLDLDLFKDVNDRRGHAAGDEVLQRVARVLVRAFRAEDVVARWGGEEFVVGMFGAEKGDGVQRLDQVLARVREERFGEPGAEFSGVTFSAGIAEFPRDG